MPNTSFEQLRIINPRMAAMDRVWGEIQEHDLADQKALKAMMPANGWFSGEDYSKKASPAAFLIVQHAGNDSDLMRRTLAKLEPLAKSSAVYGGPSGGEEQKPATRGLGMGARRPVRVMIRRR